MKNKINTKTVMKSILYRFYSSIVTAIIGYSLTKNIKLSLSIGSIDFIIKIATYYLFDSIWNKFFNKTIKPSVVFFTGLSGSGKTTIGKEVCDQLRKKGQKVIMLDGDEIRKFFPNTGFDEASRKRHNLNVGYMASFFQQQGVTCVVTMIAPYADVRDSIRETCENYVEVYISTPIDECERRDPKGLYKKVRNNEIKDFTGIHKSAPYESPKNPELFIDTISHSKEECAKDILNYIWKKI